MAFAAADSGTFDGQSFTNALVTFSGSANTSDVTSSVAGGSGLFNLDISVSVAGIGTGDFINLSELLVNQTAGYVALGETTTNLAILATLDPTDVASYDLSTSFGPISGTGLGNPGHIWDTSAGDFVLDSTGTATFEATVTGVPEPASWALLRLGVAMVGLAVRQGRGVLPVEA